MAMNKNIVNLKKEIILSREIDYWKRKQLNINKKINKLQEELKRENNEK